MILARLGRRAEAEEPYQHHGEEDPKFLLVAHVLVSYSTAEITSVAVVRCLELSGDTLLYLKRRASNAICLK